MSSALAQRPVGVPSVLVDDGVQALQALARDQVRQLLPGTSVVAVTGSAGKTSTKDLIAATVAPRGPVVAPVGSFNNDLGLPLTILRADAGTATLVLEMGMRGPGQARRDCAPLPSLRLVWSSTSAPRT